MFKEQTISCRWIFALPIAWPSHYFLAHLMLMTLSVAVIMAAMLSVLEYGIYNNLAPTKGKEVNI